MSAQPFQPFPYAALPSVSRAEISARARLGAVAEAVSVEGLASALTDLVEAPVRVTLQRARPFDAGLIPRDALGAVFARSDDVSLDRAVLVEAEPALAAVLVTRALRQRAPKVTDPSKPPPAAVAGAFAAVVHAALRRAIDAPIIVRTAGLAAEVARDLTGQERVTAWLAVSVDGAAFDARVTVPAGAFERRRGGSIAALGDARVAIPLVALSCTATRSSLHGLRPGDILVPPGFPLAADGDALLGPVAIVVPSSERGLTADLAGGGRLVVRTETSLHPHEPMSEPNATLEVLDDAPIVVRVELGTVEMKASEWAALGPGDVLTLGRKLGDPAVLRVGGVEIARGELVQVDGEYGIRILGNTP